MASAAPRNPRSVLQGAVRRHLRHNAFLALRDYDRASGPKVFAALMSAFVLLKVFSLIVMFVSWRGWLWDPSSWAGAGIVARYHSPFHGHPNPFGWRFGFQGLLIAHNITGVLLFAVCLVPLIARKGDSMHLRFGRAFVILWILHLVNGLTNSAQLFLVRGFEPTRYYDTLGEGFSLYLYLQFAFISSMVIDFLAHGLASLHYKSKPPGPAIRALMITLPATSLVFGLALMVWGAAFLLGDAPPATPKTQEFAIIYCAQVPAYVYLLVKNIVYWARPSPRAWLRGWLTEHQRNMMFCVQVTLYTGIANATMRDAPWLTPVMFIAIDAGFIIWLLTKEAALRRRVVGSRVGLALLAALRRPGAKHAPGPAICERDQRWIMRLFDIDHSGTLDLGEIRTLLHDQGVELNDAELDALEPLLDRNADGKIDCDEFGAFLTEWVAPDPSVRDELALAFRALDGDGDGHIGAEDLRRALGTGDGALAPDELAELMTTLDVDRSGAIEWSELLAALAPGELEA